MNSPFDGITVPTTGNATIDINSDSTNFGTIISGLLPWIYGIAGIILLFNIISSGLKMMTSQGDPKALSAAQAKLTTSILGIFILFASFFIVRLIMSFIGINTTLFI